MGMNIRPSVSGQCSRIDLGDEQNGSDATSLLQAFSQWPWTQTAYLDECKVSHDGGLRQDVIQLHTELPDSDNDGKFLTVDYDIEVSFIFLLTIIVHVIDVGVPFCSGPQEQCHLLQPLPQQQQS